MPLLMPCLVAVLLAACGGGDAPGPEARAPSATLLRGLAPSAAALPAELDTTALLNWAEREYPQHFPGRQVNLESPPYTYRHYPATGNHVGVAGDDVYILGPVSDNLLTRVGSKQDFVCRVLPAQCPTPYARAGWTARLTTLQHGVSGTVTVIDARTLRLSGFHYDGGGPQVFAYLGVDNSPAAFTVGTPIGARLNSPFAYADATIDLQLPEGQTLDGYAAVSIWCAEFGVNFGSGLLAPPATGLR